MRSEKFYECNLFLLKNEKTGDVLMMHSNFNDKSSDTFFYQNPRRAVKPEDDVTRYTLKGISDAQTEQLKTFLSQAGEKVGVSLFKNHHGWGNIGGEKDHGITKFLERQGVKMRRHAIPIFEGNYKFYGFDAEYNPASDTLEIKSRSEVKENAEKMAGTTFEDPKGIFSPGGDGEDVSLLKIHPFQNLDLWKSQQGKSR